MRHLLFKTLTKPSHAVVAILIIGGWLGCALSRLAVKGVVFTQWEDAIVKAGDVALVTALLTMMVAGLWSVRRHGPNLAPIAMASSALLMCVGLLGTCVWAYYVLVGNQVLVHRPTEAIELLRLDMNDDRLPQERRAERGMMYAGLIYMHDGVQATYLALDGEWVLFKPERADRIVRERLIEAQVAVSQGAHRMRRAWFVWSGVAVAGLLGGFYWTLPERKKSRRPQSIFGTGGCVSGSATSQ